MNYTSSLAFMKNTYSYTFVVSKLLYQATTHHFSLEMENTNLPFSPLNERVRTVSNKGLRPYGLLSAISA